jgi:hypothetical protein
MIIELVESGRVCILTYYIVITLFLFFLLFFFFCAGLWLRH